MWPCCCLSELVGSRLICRLAWEGAVHPAELQDPVRAGDDARSAAVRPAALDASTQRSMMAMPVEHMNVTAPASIASTTTGWRPLRSLNS